MIGEGQKKSYKLSSSCDPFYWCRTIAALLLVFLMMTTLLIITPVTLLLQKMLLEKKLIKVHQTNMFRSFLLSKHMIIRYQQIPILLPGFHLTIQIQPRRMVVIIISTIMVMIMLGTMKAITRSIHIHICIRIPTCLLKYGNNCRVWKKQQQQ